MQLKKILKKTKRKLNLQINSVDFKKHFEANLQSLPKRKLKIQLHQKVVSTFFKEILTKIVYHPAYTVYKAAAVSCIQSNHTRVTAVHCTILLFQNDYLEGHRKFDCHGKFFKNNANKERDKGLFK